jgi:hypothetical protein
MKDKEIMAESEDIKEYRRQQLQGLGKSIDSWLDGSVRCVRVNDKVYRSPNWKTFEDFLFAFIQEKLTADWARAEMKKTIGSRHPIMQWYDRVANFQSDQAKQKMASPLYFTEPTGAIQGFLNLAYYLYLCEHHGVLTEKMLQRLRNPGNFEGALYELYVTASFLKAGFLLELEDENDSTGSHHEFTATHSTSGQKFSVEARTRYSSSKRAGHNAHPPRVKDKLCEALKKSALHERIVFIELNRAEYATDGMPPAWVKQIEKDFGDAETEFLTQVPENPSAYVFVTNQSFMHWLDQAPKPPLQFATGHNIVDFPASKKPSTMEMVVESRERHGEMYDLLESLGRTSVPSSFDHRTAEEYFGVIDRPMVGMTFLLPDQEGNMIAGELLDAQILEQEKSLFGQFKTDKGVLLATFPLTDFEMAAYSRSPETFLGVFKQNPRKISDPYHCYEFAHQSYRRSTSEFLIEHLKQWFPQDELKELSHGELVKRYCLNVAAMMWSNAHPEKIVANEVQ